MLIELNVRVQEMDKRFDKRISDIVSFIQILAGIFTAMTIGMAGLVFWDRKTFSRKVEQAVLSEINREGDVNRIIPALRELARNDKKLAVILKQYNLM